MDSDTCTELMLTDASCENLESSCFKTLFLAFFVQEQTSVLLKKIFGQQHGGIWQAVIFCLCADVALIIHEVHLLFRFSDRFTWIRSLMQCHSHLENYYSGKFPANSKALIILSEAKEIWNSILYLQNRTGRPTQTWNYVSPFIPGRTTLDMRDLQSSRDEEQKRSESKFEV